jgi:hypothetical protein
MTFNSYKAAFILFPALFISFLVHSGSDLVNNPSKGSDKDIQNGSGSPRVILNLNGEDLNTKKQSPQSQANVTAVAPNTSAIAASPNSTTSSSAPNSNAASPATPAPSQVKLPSRPENPGYDTTSSKGGASNDQGNISYGSNGSIRIQNNH